MSVAGETDVIQRMLNDGHLTHLDEGGHVRELYGSCPDDSSNAMVHRVIRSDSHIVEVILRCASCGREFAAAPEAMHLR